MSSGMKIGLFVLSFSSLPLPLMIVHVYSYFELPPLTSTLHIVEASSQIEASSAVMLSILSAFPTITMILSELTYPSAAGG